MGLHLEVVGGPVDAQEDVSLVHLSSLNISQRVLL